MSKDKKDNKDAYKTLKKESDVDRLAHIPFKISVEIDPMVYQKVMHWVNKSDFEVSGLGKIVVDPERNVIKVIDAILLKQENTHSTTDLDAQAICKAMFQLKDTPGDLRWWWHSHVNMGVFWSGTDEATMKELGMGGWFSATVFNQKYEYLSAYIQAEPIRLIDADVTTRVTTDLPKDVTEEWDKQYDDNVTEKSFRTIYPSSWEPGAHGVYVSSKTVGGDDDEEDNSEADKELEAVICGYCFVDYTVAVCGIKDCDNDCPDCNGHMPDPCKDCTLILEYCTDAECERMHCSKCEGHIEQDEDEETLEELEGKLEKHASIKKNTGGIVINHIDYRQYDTASKDAERDWQEERDQMDLNYGFHITDGDYEN